MPKDETNKQEESELLRQSRLPITRDCAIGVRPLGRDRVIVTGTKLPQTRPGTLGYDL